MVAWPGAWALSRPQLPEAVDTAMTEGALLDHFTSEVRSACEPSLKNPVAVVLPAVPAAYCTRIRHHHQTLERGVAHHDGGGALEQLPREGDGPDQQALSRPERLHQPPRPRGVAHRDDVRGRWIDAPRHEVGHQPAVGNRRSPLGRERGDRLGGPPGGEDGRIGGERKRGVDPLPNLTGPLPGAGRHRAVLADRAVLVGVAGRARQVELAAGEEEQPERSRGSGQRRPHASGPPPGPRSVARGRRGRSPRHR